MLHSIQYLRAVAVLAVLVLHSHAVTTAPLATIPLLSEFGWVGVRLFFVISGFIVADRIAHCAGLGDYLMRRYLRVLPLYLLATLLALALASALGGMPFSMARTDSGLPFDPTWSAYLLSSLLIVPQDAWPVFAVGWSLEFELVFYAVFGTAWFLIGPVAARLALLVLACLGAANVLPGSHAAHIFLFYFLAGCLVRDLWRTRPGPTVAVSWLVLPPTTFLWVAHLHGGPALGETGFVLASAASFAALVAIGLGLEARLARLPFHRAAMLIGDASFAIYLVHWLVFATVGTLLAGIALPLAAAEVLRWSVLAGSILLSIQVHRRLEGPLNAAALDRAKRLASRLRGPVVRRAGRMP